MRRNPTVRPLISDIRWGRGGTNAQQGRNCSNTGRTCDGYWRHRMALPRRDAHQPNTNIKSKVDESRGLVILPALTPLSSQLFDNDGEAHSFDLFRSHSVPQTNRLVDSTFWSHTVLQISHTEPAIKHGLLSLGMLQRNPELSEKQRSGAIQSYLKALSESQELVRRVSATGDYTKVLVCALVFHCVESILGNHVAARTHLRGGLRLLYDKKLLDSDFNDSIVSTYRRFDFQAMTFWDESAPFELDPRTAMRLEAIHMPLNFSTFNHAANTLVELVYWMFCIDEFYLGRNSLSPSDLETYTVILQRCRSFFHMWHDRFEEYKDKHGTHLTEFRQRCTLLHIYYLMALIHAGHDRTLPETHRDAFLPDFVRLLDLAEEFTEIDSKTFTKGVVSFEAGIVVPLFETAMRCRDPRQRRRAIALLRSAPRREGVWDSLGAAAVAECAMEVEEDGLGKVEQASDIPDYKRIYLLHPAADISKRQVHVTFFRERRLSLLANGDMQYEWSTLEQVVRF
jgi:hypothetical protein